VCGDSARKRSSFVRAFVETEQGTIAILHHTMKMEKIRAAEPTSIFAMKAAGPAVSVRTLCSGRDDRRRHRAWFTYQPLELVTT
jgi:hypothetical protein